MAKDEINALGDVVITREESLGTQRSLLRCTEKDLAASGPGSLIRDGDHVIVYLKQDDTRHMIVNSRDSFNCRFGSFKMEASLQHAVSHFHDTIDQDPYLICRSGITSGDQA